MAKADGVFIYIGTYPSEVAARSDYDIVKDLHTTEVLVNSSVSSFIAFMGIFPVVWGSFSDEYGTYHAGDYLVRTPGSDHSTRSEQGATVLLMYTRP